MEYKEITAKTVDEAITKACLELGITSDKLDYEVISEGSNGFLGIGSKDAKIRFRRKAAEMPASIKEDTKPSKAETFVKDTDGQIVTAEDIEARAAAAALRDKELGITYPEKTEKPERPYRDRGDREGGHDRSRGGYSSGYGKKDSGRRRDRRNDRGDDRRHSHEDRRSEGTVIEFEKPHEPSVPKPERKITPKTEEQVAAMKSAAQDFLTNVFKSMNMSVNMELDYSQEEGSLNVLFTGDDMGILIGKRGQTLDSLQYLTSLVINRDQNDYVRVKLDTEDYRKRRKEALENLSRNIAYKVKHTRKAVALEPMNPYERRIIHAALQDSPDVETYSEGEEPYRHVVVTTRKHQ
jgi:spoIIIJ-associated protein